MNEQGWFKINLVKAGLDQDRWSPNRWLRMLSDVEPGRWEYIVQHPEIAEPDERRWGDKKRFQAVIGDKKKRLEKDACKDFQGLHDHLFNISSAGSFSADPGMPAQIQKPLQDPLHRQKISRLGGMRLFQKGDRRFSGHEIDQMTKWTRKFEINRSLDKAMPGRNRTARVVSGLASVAGCERQGQHFDWNYYPEHGRTGFLSFFMPLTHSTVLHLWSRSHRMLELQVNSTDEGNNLGGWYNETADLLPQAKEVVFGDIISETERDCTKRAEDVTVDVGEVLVFVGHLMHAGSGWDTWETETNTRIHVYFVPAGCPFPPSTDTLDVPPWIRRYMRF